MNQNNTHNDSIDPDGVRMTTTDGEPALEIGNTEILLRTFVKTEGDDDDSFGEKSVAAEVDVECDSDAGCWFDITPADGDSFYPWVTIQPQVYPADSDGDQN